MNTNFIFKLIICFTSCALITWISLVTVDIIFSCTFCRVVEYSFGRFTFNTCIYRFGCCSINKIISCTEITAHVIGDLSKRITMRNQGLVTVSIKENSVFLCITGNTLIISHLIFKIFSAQIINSSNFSWQITDV